MAKGEGGVTKAIAATGKVMGLDLPPESDDGRVEAMDADVARFLSMMAAAADDYGKPFPVELSDIKGDAELTAITAALLQLSKDKGFAEFLDAPADPEEVTEETIIEPDGAAEQAEEEEVDFRKRMRR